MSRQSVTFVVPYWVYFSLGHQLFMHFLIYSPWPICGLPPLAPKSCTVKLFPTKATTSLLSGWFTLTTPVCVKGTSDTSNVRNP